jgi:hypothetical protein
MRTLLRWALPLLALAARPAAADTVYLADGTTLEGKVTDLGDEIRLQRGPGALTIPKRRILRIEPGPTKEEQYAARAAALRDDDLAGRLALAAWCREQGLPAQARAEHEKALRIDADCEEAHRALGHECVDGRWLPFDDAQKAKGLVLHRGQWIAPEERDLRAALEESAALRRAVVDEVRDLIHRAALAATPEGRDDARRRLAAFAAEDRRLPCLEALADDEAAVRAAAARELAAAGDARAVVPLVRRCVLDESADVRKAASETLFALKSPSTGAAFLDLFQRGNAAARVLAADGLAAFPERRAVPSLLAALEAALQGPPEISLTTAGPGSMAPPGPLVVPGGIPVIPRPGSRTGGLRPTPALVYPRVVTSVRVREDSATETLRGATRAACLRALRSCSGGRDFGEDLAKWQAWWVKEGTGAGGADK